VLEDEAIKRLLGIHWMLCLRVLDVRLKKLMNMYRYIRALRTISRAKTFLLPFAVEAIEEASNMHDRDCNDENSTNSKELMEHFDDELFECLST